METESQTVYGRSGTAQKLRLTTRANRLVRLSERLDREGGTMKYALGWACYHIYMSRKTWPRWAEDLLLPWAGYYAF